jgi:hypothetical protein
MKKIQTWFLNKRIQFERWHTRKWKEYPIEKKERIMYILNYVTSGVLLSIPVSYFFLIDVIWVRFVFLIPTITILLAYFEHYYRWVRVGYK